jgi:hypothetical protein
MEITLSNYRRRLQDMTWHFCPTCADWPGSEFEEQQHTPAQGVLCGECKARKTRGICSAEASCEPALTWFGDSDPGISCAEEETLFRPRNLIDTVPFGSDNPAS